MNTEEMILEFERKRGNFIRKYNGMIMPTHAIVSKNILNCLLANQKEQYLSINLSDFSKDTIRGLPILIDQVRDNTIGWAYVVV
jgi:hypothetical protein